MFKYSGQLLVSGEVSTTINLILTVLFLRIYHHEPTPVPPRLHYIVFRVIAPLVFYSVKLGRKYGGTLELVPTIRNVLPNDQKIATKQVKEDSKMCSHGCKLEPPVESVSATQKWQEICKVLDRLLFIVNTFCAIVAFSYGYASLYTH